MQMYDGIAEAAVMLRQADAIAAQLQALSSSTQRDPLKAAVVAFSTGRKPSPASAGGRGGRSWDEPDGLSPQKLVADFVQMFNLFQEADAAPPSQNVAAARTLTQELAQAQKYWRLMISVDLPVLNAKLKQAGLAEIVVR
jgi:hypothetical protein